MAKLVPPEAVFEALGQVKYPGFSSDILALGIVEDLETKPDGGFALTIRQASERDEVTQKLAAAIHQALGHGLGLDNVELRVRRIEAELGEKTGRVRLPGTRYVIAVGSGKGGVGKSTVAANLAVALAQLGLSVGLLDADIYGPSVPMMFGAIDEHPKAVDQQHFYPIKKFGVNLISIGFFLGEKTPIIWRGPMVMGAVRQFLKDTLWGTQDFLIVDLPPGTGDAQLTLAQQVAIDGTVIVTTPQDVALLDATRAVKMFRQVHCPILGIVENMNAFVCPDCGEREEIFGRGGADRMAAEESIPVLERVPIYTEIREGGDRGIPITAANPKHPASQAYLDLARKVVAAMPEDS
ncbi:MAG TPA: Mrp/NBP35 family ATP-binding protein [Candidatus Binataceae bacterium]|nr:Mrp/NBP35 family ATP-binding protein [Candidatus Binataceae bacterium]